MNDDVELKYHRLFGQQERIDLQLLIRLFEIFKEDVFINGNIRFRVEALTRPKELHLNTITETEARK